MNIEPLNILDVAVGDNRFVFTIVAEDESKIIGYLWLGNMYDNPNVVQIQIGKRVKENPDPLKLIK